MTQNPGFSYAVDGLIRLLTGSQITFIPMGVWWWLRDNGLVECDDNQNIWNGYRPSITAKGQQLVSALKATFKEFEVKT